MGGVSQIANPEPERASQEPVPRERMLASDADREAVAQWLRRAHDDGRLSLGEFDERVRSAYSARTYGELAPLTADLPAAPLVPAVPAYAVPAQQPAPPPARRHAGALAWRILGSMWFTVSLLNLLIWGIVSVATTDLIYPWWIWVAGPWGAVLLAGWLSGLGRRRGHDT